MRIALLLAVAAIFALPATASAERWVTYSVTVEGEGAFDYDRTSSDSEIHREARWTWQTVFPALTFKGDQPLTDSPDNAQATTTAVLLSALSTRSAVGNFYQCNPPAIGWANSGRLLEDPGIPSPEPIVGLRVLGGVGLDFDWCPHEAATSFDLNGRFVEGLNTYDTWFTVPREAIGMGRIIQLVHEEVTDRRCPDNLDRGADCRLTFEATITLDKVRDFELADGPAPELTPDDIPELPSGPPLTRVEADAVAVRALPASERRAAVSVSCPAECRGTVTATLPGKPKRVLARARFAAPAGDSRRVTLRFTRSARRQIRRAGGVILRVRTVTAGRTDTQRVRLRLAARR
jgi:hypothetical protein